MGYERVDATNETEMKRAPKAVTRVESGMGKTNDSVEPREED